MFIDELNYDRNISVKKIVNILTNISSTSDKFADKDRYGELELRAIHIENIDDHKFRGYAYMPRPIIEICTWPKQDPRIFIDSIIHELCHACDDRTFPYHTNHFRSLQKILICGWNRLINSGELDGPVLVTHYGLCSPPHYDRRRFPEMYVPSIWSGCLLDD